jgi:hypothetical protein
MMWQLHPRMDLMILLEREAWRPRFLLFENRMLSMLTVSSANYKATVNFKLIIHLLAFKCGL